MRSYVEYNSLKLKKVRSNEAGLGLQIFIVITNILAFNNISARIFN